MHFNLPKMERQPRPKLAVVQKTCGYLVDLIRKGYEIVIVHGNGPQVGMIKQRHGRSQPRDASQPNTPLSVCVAMSQAYIGYDLQNA